MQDLRPALSVVSPTKAWIILLNIWSVQYCSARALACHVDQIEKKPVSHYLPGSKVYSIATSGCNWLCRYCQNYDISQRRQIVGNYMAPEQVVSIAKKVRLQWNCLHLQWAEHFLGIRHRCRRTSQTKSPIQRALDNLRSTETRKVDMWKSRASDLAPFSKIPSRL